MKVNSKHLAFLTFVFFILGIGGTMISNYWNTETVKIPARYKEGTFAGDYDPSDIRGSYTFDDVNKSFNLPVIDLANSFGFGNSENKSQIKAKDIEGTYGEMETGELGTDSVRWFVALYSAKPFTPGEDTLMPQAAIDILKSKGKLNPEQEAKLQKKAISLTGLKDRPVNIASEKDESESKVLQIKGKTTFKDLMDAGLSKQEIETVLQVPIGRDGDKVRDYLSDKGIEFSEYKTLLQNKLDSLNK
jgi:hypothetical protein